MDMTFVLFICLLPVSSDAMRERVAITGTTVGPDFIRPEGLGEYTDCFLPILSFKNPRFISLRSRVVHSNQVSLQSWLIFEFFNR